MYLWWFCTLYLHACQMRVTIGDSGLCCFLCDIFWALITSCLCWSWILKLSLSITRTHACTLSLSLTCSLSLSLSLTHTHTHTDTHKKWRRTTELCKLHYTYMHMIHIISNSLSNCCSLFLSGHVAVSSKWTPLWRDCGTSTTLSGMKEQLR